MTRTATGDAQTQFWLSLCGLGMRFVPFQVEQLRRSGAWWEHCARWAVCLDHLPGPGCSVSWVRCKNTISGMLYVSS